MSLNNLKLSPQQLNALYKNVLIEENAISVPEEEEVKYLGNNKKNIVILVSYEGVMYLPDAQLSFLTNILTACKLSLADVAIVNITRLESMNYIQFNKHLKSKYVILFNVPPLDIDLPLDFPIYQNQMFNGCTYLYAPSLESIENDKDLKKGLWESLKNLLGIV